MKKYFIAGNWKSNKTIADCSSWVKTFSAKTKDIASSLTLVPIVICAPFPVLPALHASVLKEGLPMKIGAQNISKFGFGAYTGEVTGEMIRDFASYVIIGHSERRKYFQESDQDLAEKVIKAQAAGLQIIYCVPDDQTPIPPHVSVIAYEPVWAIGTGKTDTPENANSVIESIKRKTDASCVLYGGSVTGDNVASFIQMPSIDGVLPGGASLDPEKFSDLVHSFIAAMRVS